jgi:hypothetical protein
MAETDSYSLSWDEVEQVEKLLKDSSTFCTLPVPGFDPYSVTDVRGVTTQANTEFVLILDRNVLSLVLDLRSTRQRALTDDHKRAAAIMAFAIITGTHFNATVAVGETVRVNGVKSGQEDAALLGAMQNLAPGLYMDLVFGRAESIDHKEVDKELTPAIRQGAAGLEVDVWDRVRPQYGAALKLATLLHPCKTEDAYFQAYIEYLRWCYEDFLFVAGGQIYGSMACGPKRRKGMFKDLRSGVADDALDGVRNAAWDMRLVEHWSQEIKDGFGKSFIYLSTFDKPLLRCAQRFLAPFRSQAERIAHLGRAACEDWGERLGAEIHRQYLRYLLGVDTDQQRKKAERPGQAYWSSLIDDLEREFLVVAAHKPT